LALAMFAEELILHAHENRLEFAPQVHFISGPSLARLHNAMEVPFDMKVTLWSGNRNHVFAHNEDRFLVSFDIWEETFSVTKATTPRKTVSHINAASVEKWCMNQMSMDLSGLSSTEPFWARLEIRAENPPREGNLFGRGSVSDSGISLASLIDIFSRPPEAEQPHWTLTSPRLTLEELRKRGS
jgi:hypothetical protein